MTKDVAINLIKEYAQEAKDVGITDTTLTEIDTRFPEDGSEGKAMRWLGFIQGALYSKGVYTLDDLRRHVKEGKLTPF